MKSKLLLLVSLFAVLLVSARANVGQVAALTSAGSSVICVPGIDDQLIVIQNNGTNAVRLSFDGGAGFVSVSSGKSGTNPTPTRGFLLAPGAQIILSMPVYSAPGSGSGLHKPIVAIMVTGTTTLDIMTDGSTTVFPTN